jgi:hypothetical protein
MLATKIAATHSRPHTSQQATHTVSLDRQDRGSQEFNIVSVTQTLQRQRSTLRCDPTLRFAATLHNSQITR